MSSKLVVVTFFGVGAIAAAAVGGYSALRRNASDVQPSALQTDVAVKPAEAIADAPADIPSVRPEATQPASKPTANASQATVKATPAAAAPAPRPNAPVAPPTVTPVATETSKTDPADVRYEPAASPVEPAKPATEELTVTRDSVIGIRLESPVSSQTARVEDKVTARVARDVTVDGHTALSSGSRLEGVVSSVERGGKFKDRARIGITFNTLVLADNTRLPIDTETIFRESESPTTQAATKVGASAAIGGILGAVIGGKKGAAIGSTVGAAGGAATVASGASPDAALTVGTPLTVRLTSPITLTIQRIQED